MVTGRASTAPHARFLTSAEARLLAISLFPCFMCHCTSYLIYTFPLHTVHPLIISHFSTWLDESLLDDDCSADVGDVSRQ